MRALHSKPSSKTPTPIGTLLAETAGLQELRSTCKALLHIDTPSATDCTHTSCYLGSHSASEFRFAKLPQADMLLMNLLPSSRRLSPRPSRALGAGLDSQYDTLPFYAASTYAGPCRCPTKTQLTRYHVLKLVIPTAKKFDVWMIAEFASLVVFPVFSMIASQVSVHDNEEGVCLLLLSQLC